MRSIGLALVAVIFLVFSFTPSGLSAPMQAPAARGAFVPDEVLVAFRPGAAPQVLARAFGGRVETQLTGLGVHILKVPSGTVESVVGALSRNPLVEFAEPNGYLQAFWDPDDPYDNTTCYWTSANQCITQWAWAKVNAYAAWDIVREAGANGPVRVAVVDTGIDVGDLNYSPPDPTGHEDIVACQSVIKKSFISGESGDDDNGHGTHVAGTIGACTNNGTGVAGAAAATVRLMGVKVLDWSGSGTVSGVSQGIRWAADNGAKVINLSLGGGPSRTLQRAVNYAWNKGAVLACAAGNDGTGAKTYPAAYANCIAVAASDANDARAWFSNHGASWVDVAAPGVNILSTIQDEWVWCFLCYWYGYLPGYDALSGTSMATPHVAGLAALIWARGQCTTNTCVRSKIETTADPIPGTGSLWKYGRVNYYKAVK